METIQKDQLNIFQQRVIEEMSRVKKTNIDTPDFTPSNFNEQFYFKDETLYVYINGSWNKMTSKYNVGNFSIPSSAGDVSFTGIGFRPSFIKLSGINRLGGCDGYATSSSNYKCLPWAVDDATFYSDGVKDYIYVAYDGNFSIASYATLKSFDSDGFTLYWGDYHEDGDIIYEVWG